MLWSNGLPYPQQVDKKMGSKSSPSEKMSNVAEEDENTRIEDDRDQSPFPPEDEPTELETPRNRCDRQQVRRKEPRYLRRRARGTTKKMHAVK